MTRPATDPPRRGWALSQAIVALSYYVDSKPAMAGTARHILDALLA
ncbi:hypothetical protein ACN28C_31760 [Plantactinospora sp. WMMC1484]